MNKQAARQQEIHNKLTGLTDAELASIAQFIDFLRYAKKQPAKGKLLKMQGILKDHDIDLAGLKELKAQAWKHVDEEALEDG